MRKYILIMGIVVLLIGMIIIPSSGVQIDKNIIIPADRSNILYVGGNGEGNYTTIQNAINNASDGDTVFVYDDSSPYFEFNIIIHKSINLRGEDRNTTIIDGNEQDIFLINANNMSINGFTIQNTRYGIRIESSSENIISNNIFTTSRIEGILIANSSNNTISNNFIENNNYGIGLTWTLSGPGPCTYNNIINNVISNNQYRGIEISHYHRYNKIIGNTISNNNKYGIKICCICNDNIIYHNNFQGNGQNAEDSYNNTWDDGYPSGGNYWDDYNGTDNDGDGLGDTPYYISGGNNNDSYPLMEPWGGLNIPPDAPVIDGPSCGRVGVEIEYNFSFYDSDNDSMYLRVDWGNGTTGPWYGPFDSGSKVMLNHTWNKKGTYTIKAQSKDTYSMSDWAELKVTMQKDKAISNSLLLRFLERYPLLNRLLSLTRME